MSALTRTADLALLKKLRPQRPGLARRVLPGMSAAADRSQLWLAVAILLAAFGGRRGRRAAAEGVLAIAVSSALVNGPLKQIVRRPRPGHGIAGPFVPERGRAPKTSSMPSGHATAAAAFTVAVGARMPIVGAPVAGMAGLVAWSRLNAGRHYTTDVLAGLAVGSVVGAVIHVATGRIVPFDDQPARSQGDEEPVGDR